MATKNAGFKKLTGAEQRALAEQLAQAKVDPAVEALGKEQSFLKSLGTAQDDFEWIMSHEAWTVLGHDTFAGWWESTVQPIMRNLPFRPTREVATVVLDRVRAEEAELPPKQRRSQKELALLAGVSPKTVQRRSQDPSQRTMSAAEDLAKAADVDPEPADVPEALRQAIEDAAHSRCEKCRAEIGWPAHTAGQLQCPTCDPSSLHRAIAVDGVWTDVCDECARIERLTSAAGPPANPEDASPVLGEPVEVEQPQAGAPDGGSVPGPPSGVTRDQERIEEEAVEPPVDTSAGGETSPSPAEAPDSPAADASTTLPHAGVPAAGAQIEEHIEDAELIRCPLCVYAVASRLVRGRPVRASLDEMLGHLQRSHDLGEDEAEDVLAARYSPAAASTPPPTAQAHPSPAPTPQQQPGPDSPTGIEGSRSETIHHTSAGVSDVGGAPEVAASVEQGLEDGGTAQDLPSSTDPDVLLRLFAEFLHALDRTDIDVLAPLLLSEEMQQLHEAADRVATFVELVERWRTK